MNAKHNMQGRHNSGLAQAISEWTAVLDEDSLVSDTVRLNQIETTNFETSQVVPFAIRPKTTAQVAACVKIAQRHGVPLYPVSQGKNWGFGSRVPIQSGSVVMELANLNTIEDYNEEFGYFRVGPGVTFSQASKYLEERGSPFFVSVIGGSGEASIIGNVLERGDGTGHYAERADFVCALEVVTPTGQILKTGFSAFPESRVANLCKWGVGPSADGLFGQSNFGVVTKMTVWLNPKPRCFEMVIFSTDDDEAFGKIIDSLRELSLTRTLTTPAYGMNDFKQLANLRQYPWCEAEHITPLPPTLLDQYKAQYKFSKWNCMAGIYAESPAIAKAVRNLIKQKIGPHAERLVFVDEGRARWMRRLQRPLQGVGLDVRPLVALWDKNPFIGQPFEMTLRSLYWRKTTAIPDHIHPDRDRCGLYWNCVVVPCSHAPFLEASKLITEIILSHGLEPNLAFMVASGYGRSIRIFVMYLFDRDREGEEAAAHACHQELFTVLEEHGYTHNRLDITTMTKMPPRMDDWNEWSDQIRRATDPSGILAPGRYEFSPSSS